MIKSPRQASIMLIAVSKEHVIKRHRDDRIKTTTVFKIRKKKTTTNEYKNKYRLLSILYCRNHLVIYTTPIQTTSSTVTLKYQVFNLAPWSLHIPTYRSTSFLNKFKSTVTFRPQYTRTSYETALLTVLPTNRYLGT